jgi:hypothetical protein
LFTTENIAGYFNALNLKNKSVLVVSSSGDHVFNAAYLGAKSVTAFDISTFTKYYLFFKKAAIKAFNYSEFINFFFGQVGERFLYENFKFIENKIEDEEIIKFWNKAYELEYFDGELLYNSALFKNTSIQSYEFVSRNMYGLESTYTFLKEKIDQTNIKFIQSDILELPSKLEETYDVIIMSNISDYLIQLYPNMEPLEKLRKLKTLVIDELGSKLNPEGKIQLAYLYNNKFSDEHFHREIYNSEYREKFFTPERGISTLEFLGAHEYNGTDAVLIYTKK